MKQNILQIKTDVALWRECRLEELKITLLSRVRMNEMPEEQSSMLAVAGTSFSCVAAVRHRLPVKGLRLRIVGAVEGRANPVLNVVFPEQATLLPDVISGNPEVDVPGNTTQIFLLRFELPANQSPGEYEITVTAESETHSPLTRSFVLQVLPPVQGNVRESKVVFWPHWETFCHYLKLELWSEAFWTAAEAYLKEMAAGGMNVIMASICHDPFRYPLPPEYYEFNHYPAMVRWHKDDGKWHFDYAIYDRYVELNMRLGIDREIECHSLLPCKCQDPVLTYYDENGRMVQLETTCDSAKYREAWTAFLTDFVAHNRERGWADKLTICPYDEPQDRESFRSVARLAKSVAPELRITAAITAEKAFELAGTIDIATIHLESDYNSDAVTALRQAGVEVRWYNCCEPAWGNTLFNCSLADSYRIGWMTEAGGYGGYLRWAVIDWPEQVYSNPGFNWPTGDTYLLYPEAAAPVESLRWHAYKQGLQDLKIIAALPEARELLAEYGIGAPLRNPLSPGEIQQHLYRIAAAESCDCKILPVIVGTLKNH